MATIRDATFPDDLDTVRALLREYAESLPVDLEFQDFEAEVATLPGKYARPHGRLLLAYDDDRVLGCIGLRALSGTDCEMKRLYVRDAHRGLGIGRKLLDHLLDEAQRAGYSEICCDTMAFMEAAQRMYLAAGFELTGPYSDDPTPGAVFFRLPL